MKKRTPRKKRFLKIVQHISPEQNGVVVFIFTAYLKTLKEYWSTPHSFSPSLPCPFKDPAPPGSSSFKRTSLTAMNPFKATAE